MATFEYSVDGQSITTTKAGRLVSGTIGVNTVKFTFDSSWDGLEKWATFDPNPGKPYKQPLDANGECLIPGEVMGGITLRIGAFGLADGQAYPTVWANKLQMEEGCFIEVPVSDWPEPSPVIEEILEELENKVDKPEDATPGNVAVIGSNSNIIDGGFKATEAFPVESASGAFASFSDGADGVPIKSMTVQIDPVQDGSGDPSPSNVRAISGWTKSIIYRTGKNLVDAYHDDTLTATGYSNYTLNQGVVTVTGNTLFGFVVPVRAGVSYNFSFLKGDTSNNINLRVREYSEKPSSMNDASYIAMPVNNGFSSSARCQVTYTPSAMTRWVWFGFFRNGVPSGNSMTISEFQIEVGTSFTEYTPFVSRNTYTIEFPSEAGTVYGGELTVADDGSGTLTVNKEMVTISQITWSRVYLSGHYVFRSNSLYGTASQQGWCECYNVVTGVSAPNVPDDCILLRSNTWDSNNRIAIRDDTYEDATAFKNAMGSYKIVREAKNPATYQLTAPQVRTLLGLNNIWADTGDISLEYHADPTIFVEEKTKAIKETIAPVEDGYTASQSYVVGSFLYVGDTLYKVTSAIASGATITPNTNVTATTVAEQLMALA